MWWLWPHFKRLWAAVGTLTAGLTVTYVYNLWSRQAVPDLRSLFSFLQDDWIWAGGGLIALVTVSVLAERAHRRHEARAPRPQRRDNPSVRGPLMRLASLFRSLRPVAPAPAAALAGRESELAQLHEWFTEAEAGPRRVMLVSGDAGVGKTTLVRAFLNSPCHSRSGSAGELRIGHGQCVEQYGAAEPYMPILEALTRLCREPGGDKLVEILHRLAPAWLAQMPSLVSAEDRARLQGLAQGTTQQRMLREMVEALGAIAAEQPLMLVLEDLQWGDPSTLDLMAAVAQQVEPARLMILATCEPIRLLPADHPLRALGERLERRHLLVELPLGRLDDEMLAAYRGQSTAALQVTAVRAPLSWASVASLTVASLAGLAVMAGVIAYIAHHRQVRVSQESTPPPVSGAEPALPDIPSIAVLPFANLSGDPAQEYFSDGIAYQLISGLSKIPGLFVIARNSSFAFKGKSISEQEIGKELGVKYLLEGSAQKSPDRVRIAVDLVDAGSGGEVWTRTYDQPLKEIFALQDAIVGHLVTTLGLLITSDKLKAPHSGPSAQTENLEAFDDLLRAHDYWWRMTKADSRKAQTWAEKALELDPNNPEIYEALASTLSWNVFFGWSENPPTDLARAAELAEKALVLDDLSSVALTVLCGVHYKQRLFNQAVAECERAVKIDPNSAFGYQELADALIVSNRPEETLRAAEKAMRFDPTRQDFYIVLFGFSYVNMGRYQEAIPFLRRHIATYPTDPWAHATLAEALVELGRDNEARSEVAKLIQISPNFTIIMAPNKDAAVNARIARDLHKAGLK